MGLWFFVKSKFSNNGQVSTELLVGVLILFVFLLIVFMQNSFVSNSSVAATDVYAKNGECLQLAFAISKVYTEGDGTKITFELANDANIISLQKTVLIGENYCRFLARASDNYLTPGTITLSNLDGVVVFS